MSDYVKTVSDVIQEMKMNRNSSKIVRDWKTLIPPGSRWNPKDPGDPACKTCEGTGYLRLEGFPIGHPYFGKIFLCDCTKTRVKQVPPLLKEFSEPEPPPFLDDPIEQETQAAFDTGEAFREFARRKSVK